MLRLLLDNLANKSVEMEVKCSHCGICLAHGEKSKHLFIFSFLYNCKEMARALRIQF